MDLSPSSGGGSMTQALNYTPKAIDCLKGLLDKQQPYDRIGL
jgi:hypothetical protein